jgi:Rieske Fe-S protein
MEVDRRTFVVAAALGAYGCLTGCGGAGSSEDDSGQGNLSPEVNPNGTVDVGALADYPRDGVYEQYADAHRVLVVRRAARVYALRSVCTHKACLITPSGSALACPCHGSRFELDGRASKGPATRPLWHYAISQDAGGRLIVDKSRKFRPDAADPAMSVAVA